MTDSRIDLLDGVLTRTGDLLRALPSPLPEGPTPCSEFDIAGLVDHICRWVRVFAQTADRRPFEGDPEALALPDDPGAVFAEAASAIVAGWKAHGTDGTVPSFSGGDAPAEMSLGITIMEYIAHGWDLARATGRPIAFDDAAVDAALTAAQQFVLPEYRGPGFFADPVPVSDDAPALDRYVAFLGRDPNWTPAG